MGKTSIGWTQETWNPIMGCSMAPGSELGGCLNCYAARMAARNLPNLKSPSTGGPFAVMRDSGPRWTGKVELIKSRLEIPLRRKKPTTYFVNSMSDLFHESLNPDHLTEVFEVMAQCCQHTFQILTKRPALMFDFVDAWVSCRCGALRNVWLGVSCENQPTADNRILQLLQTPAAIRFVSLEPLLGEIDIQPWIWDCCVECGKRLSRGWKTCTTLGCDGRPRPGLDWVIVGGESGRGARQCRVEWIESIISQCRAAGVPVFVKQLGSYPVWAGAGSKPIEGSVGKNDDPQMWPESLRVQQWPKRERSRVKTCKKFCRNGRKTFRN